MKKLIWIGVITSFVSSMFSCEPEPCKKTIDTFEGPMTIEYDFTPPTY